MALPERPLMRILLPPSESKRPNPRRGRPVDLAALPYPELEPVRAEVRQALDTLTRTADPTRALGVPPGVLDQALANLDLLAAPARPAIEVYDGVLYEALDWATLSPRAKRRARDQLLIQSSVWGLVGPQHRITGYRINACAAMPSERKVETAWRDVLPGVLAGLIADGPIVDCRSGTYTTMGRVRPAHPVRVFQVVDGVRRTVSHHAKHTRGLVARWLLEADRTPRTPGQVVAEIGRHADCTLVGDTIEVVA
ncbi:YaaA family protein [Propionibacteriaceae bacterium Y2011]